MTEKGEALWARNAGLVRMKEQHKEREREMCVFSKVSIYRGHGGQNLPLVTGHLKSRQLISEPTAGSTKLNQTPTTYCV